MSDHDGQTTGATTDGMHRLPVIAAALSAVTFFCGAFVLAGWVVAPSSAAPEGGRAVMMPGTALAFVVVGLSLLLRKRLHPPPLQRTLGLIGAWLVVVFGLAVLSEYVFQQSLGLDEMIVHARPAVSGGPPGRPAANTAVGFVLLGLSIVCIRVSRWRTNPAELLAVAVIVIAYISMTSTAFGALSAGESASRRSLTAMALSTATLFIIASTAVLLLRPTEGLMGILTSHNLGGVIVRRLLIGVAAIPMVTFAAEYSEHQGWISEALSGTLISLFTMAVALSLIFLTGSNVNRLDRDRSRREEELRRWKHFFEHAAFGAVLSTPDARHLAVNDAFARMHGMTPGECEDRMAFELFSPAARADASRQVEVVDRVGHNRFESEHLRKDGSFFPVDVDATAMRGPAGEVLYRAMIVQDITERKEAEAERARLASIVETSDDPIFSTTLEGRILTWNVAAERVFGFTAEEAIGRSGAFFMPADRAAERRGNLERLGRGQRVPPFETVRLRKDGSQVPLLATLSPVKDPSGRPIAVSGILHEITERKAMEESLQRSEERTRQMFEAAVDGIFVARTDGRYTEVNESVCRLLQLSREELVGKSIVDLLPPEEVPRLEASRTRLLRGEPDSAEWHLKRRDGTFVPVEVNAKILPDGRWMGFVRDITDRKEAERALRAARDEEQRLRLQIEALSRADRDVSEAIARAPTVDMTPLLDVILVHAQTLTNARYAAIGIGGDEEHPFESWVERGVSHEGAAAIGRKPRPVGLLGYPVRTGESIRLSDLHRHHDYRGFPPNHPDMTRLLAVPIRYRDRSVGNLYLAEKRDGAEFTADDQQVVEVLADRAGLAIETVTLYAQTDIQRVWLQTVVEHLPEATVVVDGSGRVIAHSRSAERFQTRTTPDFWGNTDILDLRDSATLAPLPRSDHPIELAIGRLEETVRRELSIRVAEDQFVPVLANVAVIRDAQGKNIGAILLLQDITAVKELERLREEWMAIVAHDLRQPVATIRMSAEMLRRTAARTEMGERILSSLDRITSSSARLGRMISDLLDASRLEARHLKLERKEFDLHELVRAVFGRMSEVFEGRPVRVIAPEQPVRVEADPDRIEQVLTNLLSNAAKYGFPGSEILVEITTGKGTAGVEVTNAGHGIPPELLPRLFDRFERAWAPKESRAPGIGLGLYICKGLVEAHCGRMWVTSTLGKTTTFGFELPVRPVEAHLQLPEPLAPGPITSL